MEKIKNSDYTLIKSLTPRLLSELIKIGTQNPPGNYDEIIQYYKELFQRENIQYKILPTQKSKKCILAFSGQETAPEKPMLLLNHYDVVPYNKNEWSFDPLCGSITNKNVLGRGALDMKGIIAIHLSILILIKRNKINLKRNVFFLSVPDEETGGIDGAKYFVDNYIETVNPEVVIDEGGFGFKNKSTPDFLISYAQKKSLWLKFKAIGESGHSSQPVKNNPNNLLVTALNKILNYKWKVELEPKTIKLFSENTFFLKKAAIFILMKLKLSKILMFLFFKDVFKIDFIKNAFRNTVSITMLSAGECVNKIPETAEAVLDFRILPKYDNKFMIKKIKNIINENKIEIEILKKTNNIYYSDTSTNFVKLTKQILISHFKKARIIYSIAPFGTDSRFFREKGINAYGFFPALLEESDIKRIHGIDEKISLDSLIQATVILYEVTLNFCKFF